MIHWHDLQALRRFGIPGRMNDFKKTVFCLISLYHGGKLSFPFSLQQKTGIQPLGNAGSWKVFIPLGQPQPHRKPLPADISIPGFKKGSGRFRARLPFPPAKSGMHFKSAEKNERKQQLKHDEQGVPLIGIFIFVIFVILDDQILI